MGFNQFGVTTTDIVNAFKGSLESDFGGTAVILSEMQMAESEISAKLSTKALQLMARVDYMEIPAVSGNSFLAPFPVKNDFHIWYLPRFNPAQTNTFLTVGMDLPCSSFGWNKNCTSEVKELDSTVLFTDYTISGDTVTFGSSFDQSQYVYYASWNIDQGRLALPSLGILLRNRVACVLGHQLYSRGEDSWKLVDIYCSRGDAGLEAIDSYFIPSEFKAYKYLNPIVKTGLSTIKTLRG